MFSGKLFWLEIKLIDTKLFSVCCTPLPEPGSHSGHDKLDPNRGFLTPTPTNKPEDVLLKSFLTIYVLGIWCIILILDWGNLEATAKNGMKLIFFQDIIYFPPQKNIVVCWKKKLLFLIAVRGG